MSYILSQLSKLMWIVSALCGSYELLSEFTRTLTLTQYVTSLVGSLSSDLSPSLSTPLAAASATTPIRHDAVRFAREALQEWEAREPADRFGDEWKAWSDAKRALNAQHLEVLRKYNAEIIAAYPAAPPPPLMLQTDSYVLIPTLRSTESLFSALLFCVSL